MLDLNFFGINFVILRYYFIFWSSSPRAYMTKKKKKLSTYLLSCKLVAKYHHSVWLELGNGGGVTFGKIPFP